MVLEGKRRLEISATAELLVARGELAVLVVACAAWDCDRAIRILGGNVATTSEPVLAQRESTEGLRVITDCSSWSWCRTPLTVGREGRDQHRGRK
jgi:hypothetical protein